MEKDMLVRPALGRAGDSSRLLLERETELSYLTTTFRAACEGHGSVVALDGPPGVGKSHLLAAASQIARDEGLQVLTAAGREIESEFTFGVTLQLLEARVAQAGAEERVRLFAGAAQRAAPLLARGHGDEIPDNGDDFSLLQGLHWLCANIASEQPLAIVVDDAHHADDPSLRFAIYLAQRFSGLPICLVLAGKLRFPEPSTGHLSELLAHPITHTLTLAPLSPAGVATLLRRSFFPGASDSFCLACFGATGGNPFLLRELAVDLATRAGEHGGGDAADVLEAAPDSIARSVLLRLHGVGPSAVELAKAVAVLGHGAELRHAARIAELGPQHAARLADEIMSANVFAQAELLSFMHPIVRRAVEAALTPAERAALHLRAGRTLAEDGASLPRVAAHLLHSSRTGSEWVVDVLADAAALSVDAGTPQGSVAYLRRALEEPPTPSRRPELVLQLGHAEALMAAPEAVPRLREALNLVREPVERGVAALALGRALSAQGSYTEAADVLQRGLGELGGADAELRAQLRAAYGAAARLGRSAEQMESDPPPPERALASEPPGTSAARVALAEQSLTRALDGQPVDQVRDLAHQALGRDTLLAIETADGAGYYMATTALTVCEDYRAAEVALTAAIEDARTRGATVGYATACALRALTFFGRGRLGEAEIDAEAALEAVPAAHGVAFSAARAVLAGVLMERGQLDDAEKHVAASSPPEGSGAASLIPLATHGALSWRRGDATTALDAFEHCGAGLADANIRNPAVLSWRSGAALALADLGDRERAARVMEEELELAQAFGAPGAIGSALHATALLATGGRREKLLLAALEALDRSDMALARARVLVELGASLRRAGTPRAARDPLRQGLDLAERCGALVLAQRAREEVTAAGSRPRRTALSGAESLTARERQVVDLAAEGMSNREIAGSLYVTVKTVEWHLSHAFEKLGVRSRYELGAVMTGVNDNGRDGPSGTA